MRKLNRISTILVGSLALMLAGSAMADPSLNPWSNGANPNGTSPSGSGSSATNPSGAGALPSPNSPVVSFPNQQAQNYQAMLQQLQQAQQTYINNNSLNPANYNLPPLPAPIPTPAPNPMPYPAPTPGGAIPTPNLPNPTLQN